MELLDKQSNPFVQEVLSGLVDFMRTRRSMLFITCFCGGDASPFHTETYGSVCFRFSLRTTRLSVCCRPEITSFLGQGDRTCRRIACLIGDDVRVIDLWKPFTHSTSLGNVDVAIEIAGGRLIVTKPPIHSPKAFRASVAAVASVIVLAAMQALRAFQRKEFSGLKTEPDLRSRRGVRSPQD